MENTQPKTVTLSDGRVATILQGKGKNARNAMMKCEGKSEEYLSLLMADLVLVDGNKLLPEDFDEMPMADYTAVQVAFAEVNF